MFKIVGLILGFILETNNLFPSKTIADSSLAIPYLRTSILRNQCMIYVFAEMMQILPKGMSFFLDKGMW